MTEQKVIDQLFQNQKIIMENQLELLRAIKGEKCISITVVKSKIDIKKIHDAPSENHDE